MKCQNCGYENPTEGTKDNKWDQCGYLLIQNNSISAQVDSSELTNGNLVVIATFNNSVEASLTQEILKTQGIESWFQDDATVNLAWHLTIAVGGIKLFVREQDEQLARTILDEYQASLNEETSQNNDLTPEVVEESHLELTSTDKILRRALRVAVVGLIFLPLQLYSLWLLLTLFWKGLPKTQRQRLTFIITLGLDLAVLIFIWSFINS